jgi:hypothetical protein
VHNETSHNGNHGGMYGRLWAMAALSYVSMYILMYAMVDALPNIFNNLNQVYMAGLMAAPMVVIEVLLMGKMYPNKKLNAAAIFASLVFGFACWIGIRAQVGIGDTQFLRSMIPHHAGAILMCNEADLEDPEILELCEGIKAGQQSEIDFMKRKLGIER